jgi:type II secretory ATPase GspE/PulE/Tfp pilus assembly ATPase PilB-like protein
VNYILEEAIKRRASDIYMELTTTFFMFSIRVEGILHDLIGAPPRLQNAVIDRVRFMAKLDIAEKRLPQDGRISVRVGGRGLDLRVSTDPATSGEKVVIQILDSAKVQAEGHNQ